MLDLGAVGTLIGGAAWGFLAGLKGSQVMAKRKAGKEAAAEAAEPEGTQMPTDPAQGLARLAKDHQTTRQLVASVELALGQMKDQLASMESEISGMKESIARIEGYLEALGRRRS